MEPVFWWGILEWGRLQVPGRKGPTPPPGNGSFSYSPKGSMANCLSKETLSKAEGNIQIFKGCWGCLSWNASWAHASFIEQPTCNDRSAGKYKSPATWPQLRAPQKSHLSYRVAHQVGLGLHCDCIMTRLLPLPGPPRLFLPRSAHMWWFPPCSAASQSPSAWEPNWDNIVTVLCKLQHPIHL